MARPTLEEIQGLTDPLQTDSFELLFGNIPGGLSAGSLRLRCQQISRPGHTNEQAQLELHGQKLNFAGRKTYSGTLSATFTEHSDGVTARILEQWSELCKGTNTGKSAGYKQEYAVNADLIIYDVTGSIVETVTIEGIWPTEVSELQLDGQSTQIALYQSQFSYDVYRSNLKDFL